MTSSALRVWQHSPAAFFESGFSRIAESRMQGLPIVNPDVHVRAIGFDRHGNDWLGAVVTPWSILVVLACGNRSTWEHVPVTQERTVKLPSGDYRFMGMNDPILGEYQSCSLMSPLIGIADQQTAEAIAHQALTLMRQSDVALPEAEEGQALVPDPYIDPKPQKTRRSRRAFLFGDRG